MGLVIEHISKVYEILGFETLTYALLGNGTWVVLERSDDNDCYFPIPGQNRFNKKTEAQERLSDYDYMVRLIRICSHVKK